MSTKNPNVRYGQCNNIGNCPKANAKEIIEIPLGEDFVCPNGCGPLTEVSPDDSSWKKIALAIGAVIVVGGAISAILLMRGEETISSLTLSHTTQELFVGDKDTLTVTNTPIEAKVTYAWTSSNEMVAKVNAEGIVETVGEGEATIRVTAAENEQATAVCTYKVKKIEKEPGTEGGEEAPPLPPGGDALNLGYAVYEGPSNNGQPDGIGGKLTFKKNYTIDLKNVAGESVAVRSGEYITNTKYQNGRLLQGQLHHANGTQKWIMIGQ